MIILTGASGGIGQAILPSLAELDNVIASPHTAGVTADSRDKMSEFVATQLLEIFDGKDPARPVNPEIIDIFRQKFKKITS